MAESNVLDVSQRLLIESALCDYAILTNVSDADIAVLYDKIEKLNEKCFEDEKSFETVTEYELDSIHSKEELKKRIESMRSKIAEEVFIYYDRKTLANKKKISAIMKNIGIASEMSDALAQKIVAHQLHEGVTAEEEKVFPAAKRRKNKLKTSTLRWAEMLALSVKEKIKKLRQNISNDLQTYKDMNIHNPVIEEMKADIESHISYESMPLYYDFQSKGKDFNNQIREDFNRPDGVKSTQFKIIGLLARNGLFNLKNGQTSNNNENNKDYYNEFNRSYYNKFKKIIEQYYGADAQKIIDNALNISREGKTETALQEERLQNFQQKSKETYVKLAASLLNLKRQDASGRKITSNDYRTFAELSVEKYIRSLCEGKNSVEILGFVDTEYYDTQAASGKKTERELQSDIKNDLQENKYISVHHHLPVAAAADVSHRLCGEIEESKLLSACNSLVNTLGNITTVIGRERHDSLDSESNNGKYELKSKPNSMILASRINWETLKDVCLSLPKYLKEEINKLEHKEPDISVMMKFPEAEAMTVERQKLQVERQKLQQEQDKKNGNVTELEKVLKRFAYVGKTV